MALRCVNPPVGTVGGLLITVDLVRAQPGVIDVAGDPHRLASPVVHRTDGGWDEAVTILGAVGAVPQRMTIQKSLREAEIEKVVFGLSTLKVFTEKPQFEHRMLKVFTARAAARKEAFLLSMPPVVENDEGVKLPDVVHVHCALEIVEHDEKAYRLINLIVSILVIIPFISYRNHVAKVLHDGTLDVFFLLDLDLDNLVSRCDFLGRTVMADGHLEEDGLKVRILAARQEDIRPKSVPGAFDLAGVILLFQVDRLESGPGAFLVMETIEDLTAVLMGALIGRIV